LKTTKKKSMRKKRDGLKTWGLTSNVCRKQIAAEKNNRGNQKRRNPTRNLKFLGIENFQWNLKRKLKGGLKNSRGRIKGKKGE